MPRRSFVLLALASTAVAGSARADVVDEAWRRGNQAYLRGEVENAAAIYQQLADQGVASADLFYNLGVASVRLDRLGRAIWAFERALVLEPGHEDARFNLARARTLAERRVRDKIEGMERDAFWIRAARALPPAAVTWLFLGVHGATFLLLFLRRGARAELRPALGIAGGVLGTVALAAGLLLLARARLDRISFAIVLADAAEVKEGADESYRAAFKIHAGLKVRVLERERHFARVRLANGLEGWVAAKDVGVL